MMTNEQIAAHRANANARLAEIALDLRDDPKDHGAKRERAALKRVLKSLAQCEKLARQFADAKQLLAAL